VLAVVSTVLHIISRIANRAPIDGLYVASILTIGAAALYSLRKLNESLPRAMFTFALVAAACITGLLVYIFHAKTNYQIVMFMFHVGILSLGLVLGFRAAIQYAILSSSIIVLLGIVYDLPPASIVIPVFFAFAVALPSKVVEQLIEQSTEELTELNLRLEDLVEARTAELRAEVIERQRAQEALFERTIELEKRNEELDAYAHTVAHDLKSPLTSLVGFSELLQKRAHKMTKEQLEEYHRIIAGQAQKAAAIVDALLLLASVRKIEDVQTECLNLACILEDILCRLADVIAESQAEIITADDFPPAVGYRPWVEEVLVNYVSNAIKYGGRPPRVEIGATDLGNGYVRLWVRDNGKGLTPEEQARLFTPFTRLNQIQIQGYGLGLSIVQRIAEKLNGQVGVESEVGQGSIFYFTLPTANSIDRD